MESAGTRLAAELIGEVAPSAFVAELGAWLGSTPRLRPFVTEHRAKIRRKVRGAGDAESVRDVRAELLVAARLLADRRFDVAFETYAAGGAGPDFTVTLRQTRRFTVEVTRRRGVADAAAVVDAAVSKLRQLPPSIANVVVVAVDEPVAAGAIAEVMRSLRARVDARDANLLARVGAGSPRAFYERFLRLAAVVAWTDLATGSPATWANASARIPLDAATIAALARALEGSADGPPARRARRATSNGDG